MNLPERRLVAAEAFEARLAEIAASVADPTAGLFGPGSMMWRLQGEAGLFLGAGAALLLQTAHPFVAQGVADHSRALADPLGRYYRTFRPAFAMVFGTRADALSAARRVHAVHERIRGVLPDGTPYAADDPDALFWVHATLWHTSVTVYERLIAPLSGDDKDRYARETARFAGLFGIPDAQLPATWTAFEARFARLAGEMAVGTAGRRIGSYFLGRGPGSFGRVLPGWYRKLTASLLPPALSDAFGLSPVTPEEALPLWRRLAWIHRRLPQALRCVGPYQEARLRMRGRPPGLWVGLVNRVWLGRSRLSAS